MLNNRPAIPRCVFMCPTAVRAVREILIFPNSKICVKEKMGLSTEENFTFMHKTTLEKKKKSVLTREDKLLI